MNDRRRSRWPGCRRCRCPCSSPRPRATRSSRAVWSPRRERRVRRGRSPRGERASRERERPRADPRVWNKSSVATPYSAHCAMSWTTSPPAAAFGGPWNARAEHDRDMAAAGPTRWPAPCAVAIFFVGDDGAGRTRRSRIGQSRGARAAAEPSRARVVAPYDVAAVVTDPAKDVKRADDDACAVHPRRRFGGIGSKKAAEDQTARHITRSKVTERAAQLAQKVRVNPALAPLVRHRGGGAARGRCGVRRAMPTSLARRATSIRAAAGHERVRLTRAGRAPARWRAVAARRSARAASDATSFRRKTIDGRARRP